MMNTPLLASVECDHGMGDPAWCSLCRSAAGYMPGSDRQRNDCSIQAVRELAGVEYAEAELALYAAGKRGGQGAFVEQIINALMLLDVTVRRTHTIRRTGSYLVAAWIGKSGHAFTVVEGRVINAGKYAQARRQEAFEVV